MSNQVSIDAELVKYLQATGYRSDPVIDKLVDETLALGNLSSMQIAPEQGQFLEIIVKILNANSCLEIGRFTGLSSLCIARGLPERGKLITIDNSDEFLSMAEKYWKMAKQETKIESIIGDGVDVLQSMIDRQQSFDFVFIDADKNNYPHYYELSLKLLKPNGILIIDNMLWHGDVADENKTDKQTKTIRALNKKIQTDERINFSLLPLSDGLSFIRKK
ncbi:MAG: putative O-methyltransferase [Alphaproteobacteria bacterium MarineAlpha5_Bin5]|nr:MAG: putative O-methyltransferase [Alphaproteobacteria bacterium MarineAlpha5_Bin5]|tara:strand:+ start:8014 stop:8670 length:657 start_codon:yes stop_codon:yes gene_type:complete